VTFTGAANNSLLGSSTAALVGNAATNSTGTTSTLACATATGALTAFTSAMPNILLQ
jgi:hypothetical protein